MVYSNGVEQTLAILRYYQTNEKGYTVVDFALLRCKEMTKRSSLLVESCKLRTEGVVEDRSELYNSVA